MHRSLSRLVRTSKPLRHFSGKPAVSHDHGKHLILPRTALDFARHYPHTKVSTLSNGIRVATEESHGDSATIGVWIDTGSRYEDEKTNGVAHFLEHLSFKGTKNRSRVDLETEIENMGGHLNAYTSRESTVYYVKVLREDVPKAADILADMLQRSELSPESIENERSVILREMKEIERNMDETLFDHLHATAYRGTPLGRTILGTKEDVERISRENILDYIKTHYTANRIVIAAAGAVKHDEIVKLTEKHFNQIPSNPPSNKVVFKAPAVFTGSDREIRYDSMDQAYVALAYPAGGWSDPDTYPLMVIQQLLGTWDKETSAGAGVHHSSRLISHVAKNDLATSLMTFNTQYSDTSLFGVYTVSHSVGVEQLWYSIQKEITRLSYEVDEVRLEEAKNQLKFHVLATLDGSTSIAEDIGRQLLCYGRRLHPAEQLARIEAVDVNAVKQAARRFFYDHDHALAAIGGIYELPDYNELRRKSFWIRF